jgi:hypothetical protein
MRKTGIIICVLTTIILRMSATSVAFAWGSSNENPEISTHKFIDEQALVILNNDTKLSIIAKDSKIRDRIKELLVFKTSFIKYSTYPDEYENCGLTFISHFYDPDTKRNYAGDQKYTAINAFKYHALVAKALYLERGVITDEVVIELSKASHYLADMDEPHHAANYIARTPLSNEQLLTMVKNYEKSLPSFVVTKEEKEAFSATFGKYNNNENQFIGKVSNHNNFEMWTAKNENSVDENGASQYQINSTKDDILNKLLYIPYKSYLTGDFMEDLNRIGNDSAIFAKSTLQSALTNDEKAWKENISKTLPMAQIKVAEFLYTFLNEVNSEKVVKTWDEYPLGNLMSKGEFLIYLKNDFSSNFNLVNNEAIAIRRFDFLGFKPEVISITLDIINVLEEKLIKSRIISKAF